MFVLNVVNNIIMAISDIYLRRERSVRFTQVLYEGHYDIYLHMYCLVKPDQSHLITVLCYNVCHHK